MALPTDFPRLTIFFQDARGRGWSETHWAGANAPDLVTLEPAADLLVANRMQLCAANVSGVYRRLSFDGTFRDADIALIPRVNPNDAYNPALANQQEGQANDAIVLRMNSGPAHHKSIFLSGVPDLTIELDDVQLDAVPGFRDAFNLYVSTLKGLAGTTGRLNWGWKALDLGVYFSPVTAISTTAELLVFSVGVQPNPVTPGSYIHARGIKPNTGGTKIKGRYQVVSRDTTLNTVSVALPAGFTLKGFKNLGSIYLEAFTFLRYIGQDLVKAGTRKRGGRFLLPLGRSRRPSPIAP